MIRRQKQFDFYPDTEIKITSPFFVVDCPNCGRIYWVATPITKCTGCGCKDIKQVPADKASRTKMLGKDV